MVIDLLAIGGITIDYLFKITHLPRRYFEAEITEVKISFGGRAPNVAAMLAKLGFKTGIVSPVGDDFRSSGYEEHLRKLNVDLRGIKVLPSQVTKRIYLFSDPSGRQISFFYFGAEKWFRKMKVPSDLVKEARILHISSGDYNFNLKCARIATKKGIKISFDPGNDPSIRLKRYIKEMVLSSSLLFANDTEVPYILGSLDVKFTQKLFKISDSLELIAIINKSSKSCTIFTRDSVYSVPSVLDKVKVADLTATTDGYVAGSLAGYLRRCDIKVAALMGAAEATFIAEKEGGQTNMPTWRRLISRMRKLSSKIAL